MLNFQVPSEHTPYKAKLQANPDACEYGDILTTKEIMFFQPKSLDEIVDLANTANLLNIPHLIDSACAAIALYLRKQGKDLPQTVSQAEDKALRDTHKTVYGHKCADMVRAQSIN